MTKTRFTYERPVLFNLNGKSVVGATECNSGNGFNEGNCHGGSCVIAVMCSSGSSTQACAGGATACEKTMGCYSSCQAGGTADAGWLYYCSTYGSNASFMCANGTRASYTCSTTGGYAGSCS